MADNMMTPEEQQQPDQCAPRSGKKVLIISVIALVILIGIIAFGYCQLITMNVNLKRQVGNLVAQATTNQQTIADLQKVQNELQQNTQKSEELSAKQEKMIADWQAAQKGNMDKWYVAEAQYLTKLANDHLQFTHNASMALAMLQRAEQVLQNLETGNLLEIRKSLTADIASLQGAPAINTTELYLRLNALNQQLDQLPLPASPLKPDATQTSTPVDYSKLSWWKAGLLHTWEKLHKIIIVRNSGYKTLPLVLPEEKTYLYQNLHAQMESAQWAVLYNNQDIYQASLARLIMWVQQFMDQDASATKVMLENLTELQKINIQTPALNLAATLQQFDQYFAQQSQPTVVQ